MKNFLIQCNRFIRSLIFSILMISGIFIYSFLCVLSWVFPLRIRYALVTSWTRSTIWLLKKLCGINYHVTGLKNIPKDCNGIIMSKHQSMWETFFLPSIFYEPAIILKRELLWIPFFGWGLATLNPIAINRNDKTSAMSQIIRQGKNYLDQGRWILIFPEGTRIKPGEIGTYRIGGARLAEKTGYPIIPVAHNAGCFWQKRKFLKKPGTVQVVIGPLIKTEGRRAEDILAEVKQWIESTMKKLHS